MKKVWTLAALVLIAACDSTEETATPHQFDIEDAVLLFSESDDPIKKVTRNGEVEEVAILDENGTELPSAPNFVLLGRKDMAIVNYDYQEYLIHRPTGIVTPSPEIKNLDGTTNSEYYSFFDGSNDFWQYDFQAQGSYYVYKIKNGDSKLVELQVGQFNDNGLYSSSPVANSRNIKHFTLTQEGLLAFTTRSTESDACSTYITSLSSNEQLPIATDVFYWVGASGDLYYLEWQDETRTEGKIFKIIDGSELSPVEVGQFSDSIDSSCSTGYHYIGKIEDRTFFFHEWDKSIIEFDETTVSLRELDTEPLYGVTGAGTAGNYIYLWGRYGIHDGLDQLDPISNTMTRIYTGDIPFIAHIRGDTWWAEMSKSGEYTWIGKLEGLSSLTGPSPITEVFRPTGTFDGGLSFNYLWLGD